MNPRHQKFSIPAAVISIFLSCIAFAWGKFHDHEMGVHPKDYEIFTTKEEFKDIGKQLLSIEKTLSRVEALLEDTRQHAKEKH